MRATLRNWWDEAAPVWRSLPWTLGLIWRSHRPATALIALVTLLQGAVPAAQLWVTKLLVDQIALVLAAAPAAREALLTPVFGYLGLEALLLLAGVLVGVVSGYAYNVLGEHLSYSVQMRILEQCARLDLAAYESPEYYNQLQQAQEQGEQAPMLLLRRLLEFAQALVMLLSVMSLMLLYQPWLILLPVLATVPGFLVAIHYGRQHFFLYDNRTPQGRRAAYLGYVLSTDEYAKEVRVWGLSGYLLDMLRGLRQRFLRENLDLSRRQSLATLACELLSTLGYYGAYALIILGVVAGRLTIGDLTLYAGVFSRAQSLFETLLQAIANVYEVQLFAQRLEQFLRLEPQIVAPAAPAALPAAGAGLVVDRLSFRYPETEAPVLDGLSFSVRPGECVAIVGANGAGKSTLVKLLLRLYDPSGGSIRLGQTDLREIDPDELRRRMAVVFQDYARYQLTMRENIGVGSLEQIDDMPAVQAAAEEAGIAELIADLPDRYDTLLGRMFEGGHELSLGQWQRVALARALLRDAPILVMDEPTAAMDAQSEYDLYQQLKKLACGRMTILISHRFSTVRMADRILVLEDGKLIEEGTHEALMARDTRYAYYFRLQAESYSDVADHAGVAVADERLRPEPVG
ncbi:MAG TPA: ABC transporter ATP-binding protein [Roseiflexaceae bacterium]|nr:ABC transporter ATP-binding protein [Roseiflexaceae bacterium]